MKEDFYISLIYKELNGSITSDEQRRLAEWSSIETNAQTKAQIESVWSLADGVQETVPVDLDADFAMLQRKIEDDSKVVQMPKKSRNWLSIAAGVAILVAALFGVQRFTQTSSELVSHTAMKSNQYYMLEDGSEIYLQKGSSISYHRPMSNDRRVINLKGEGIFHVAHDKDWPLDVKTQNETITVLGTKFHVVESTNATNIQLMEGKIAVTTPSGKAIAELSPGESLIRNHSEGIDNVESTISQNDFAWQSNQLKFDNTPLDQVAKDLSSLFGVSISIELEPTENCLLTATFKEKSLDQIIAVISSIHDIQIHKEGEQIYWKGGSCE